MNRVCVFVDGENFRHSIVKLFDKEFRQEDYLPKDADWASFFNELLRVNLNRSIHIADLLRTYWFTVEHIDFRPWNVPKPHENRKIEQFFSKLSFLFRDHHDFKGKENPEILEILRKRKGFIQHRFDGWKNLQNGIATKHHNIEFRRAGGIKYDLIEQTFGEEKAVDVNLATTMITLQNIYDTAIIVSGDQDYVPAVQAVKDCGKRVINVAFETANGRLLPGGARRLNLHTDSCIRFPFEEFKKILNLD